MKIEFFHDVICSFCFPMSYRMRQVQKLYPNIEIIHRSFPLVWEEKSFIDMFGSREKAKTEILGHWIHANQNDDLHRFNITGMQKQTFAFPTSKHGLMAAKAASRLAGEEGYWEVFDRLQYALFVENRNIQEIEVVYDCIKDTSIDFDVWKVLFEDKKTVKMIEEELRLVDIYKITSVPTLVINEAYVVTGAQSLHKIIQTIENIQSKKNKLDAVNAQACNLVDGKWSCE